MAPHRTENQPLFRIRVHRFAQGGHLLPQLTMQSLYTIGGADGQSAMQAGSVPPGHDPGFGGAGGVGVGGVGGVNILTS